MDLTAKQTKQLRISCPTNKAVGSASQTAIHCYGWQHSQLNISLSMIIIALKGAIRDFYNLPTAPQTVSSMYAQVAQAQLCANHAQHIEFLSRATSRVPCSMKGQLRY